uniref:Putative ribosome-binding protein 1 n=1 Tax=Amblyomma aureolatum TaxID=187763 RepID=A0A1E1XIS9_9ACAR
MELALCAAAIFVVSAVTVLLVSLVGTRQKTYEEALAEARQRSLEEDAALQQARQHHRRDGSSKKVKGRWGRTKVKESPTEAEAAICATTLVNETLAACPPSPTHGPAQHSPEHVEFKEEAEDEIELKHLQEQQQLQQQLQQQQQQLQQQQQPQPQQQQHQQQEGGDGSWAASSSAAAKGSPLREKPPRSRRSKGSQDGSSTAPAVVAGDVRSSSSAGEIGVRELLALVRGARFSAEEEELQQQLVEELLNRAGQPGAAGEWRKRGPDPEAHLRRQLAERERDLEAERQHTLSHATKVKELRQELNQQLTKVQQQEKSLKAQQKLTEDQAAQLQRLRDESRQLQQRVHQLESELQQASASVCERVRSREEELEHSHREALERERQEAEARLAQAREQAETLEGVCTQLRQRLDQEAQNLAAQRNASEGKVKDLSKVHQLELEAERADHQRRLEALEERLQEQGNLAEELRARLAEAVQTHSREVSELSRKKAEAEAAAEGAEQRLAQAHEAAVEELRRELDDQRAKNNDLRTKNWEVVEAMRAYERKAEAQAKELTKELEALKASHVKDIQSLEQRLSGEHEQEERELLERLLPTVKVDGGLGHSEWLVCFERELRHWLKKQQEQQLASTQQSNGSSADAERLQKLTQTNARLDKEVTHYKQVLSQTEEILQSLQRSVEQEEKKWRKLEENHQKERLLWQEQLEQAQAAASALKESGPTERERQLEGRCAALEADLRQLQGLQETTSEMQAKLKELQAKLQDEEGEKKVLEQKYDEVSRNAQDVRTHLESRVRELEEIKQTRDDYDLLKKELVEVKEQLAEARRVAAKAQAEVATHSPRPQSPAATTPTKVSTGDTAASSPATNGPSVTPSPTPAEKEDKGSSNKK